MTCVICKSGETRPAMTTVTLQRASTTVVIRHVPASVCENCDEAYLDDDVARELLREANAAGEQSGVGGAGLRGLKTSRTDLALYAGPSCRFTS